MEPTYQWLIERVLDAVSNEYRKGKYGPFRVELSSDLESLLGEKYWGKSNARYEQATVAERILAIEGVQSVVVNGGIPANSIVVQE